MRLILTVWLGLMLCCTTLADDAHEHDHHGDHDHSTHAADDHEHVSDSHVDSSVSNQVWWLIGGYGVLIASASFLGGLLPGYIHFGHTQMQHMISVVGGLMLGIGLFHLFPHAVHHLGSDQIDTVCVWTMVGIVAMFFLLRAFHFHQHEIPIVDVDQTEESGITPEDSHGHDHAHCGHSHHKSVHEMSWIGVFIGLSVHTLIDGIALGASVQAESAHSMTFGLFGLGTFAAIALHKPLDSLSISSLMIAGGWSKKSQLGVNLFYAALCPLGAVAFLGGVMSLGVDVDRIVGCTLAFAAGVFMCIALSDLLPEMEFHSHHRKTLTAALLFGIALAWAIRYLEPAHIH